MSHPATDDDTLASMYLAMWALATGRRLRPGVKPGHLCADDLIEFWAEDLRPASGRHAARDAGSVEPS